VGLGSILPNRVLTGHLPFLTICIDFLVLETADERQTMYNGFSDKGGHSTEWVQITKEFLNLAFASGHREVSCQCSRCENRRMLSKYEISSYVAKKGFMSNYLVWHQHREVHVTPLVPLGQQQCFYSTSIVYSAM
jgi:hypothetical protein